MTLFASAGFPRELGFSDLLLVVVFLLVLIGICFIPKLSFTTFNLISCFTLVFLLSLGIIERGNLTYEISTFNIIGKLLVTLLLTSIYRVRKKDFRIFSIKIIEWMMILSIITFALSNILRPFLIQISENFVTFFGLAVFRIDHILKYGFCRNQSIFWEPSVFGLLINASFILKYFVLDKPCTKKGKLLYALSIISTFSMGQMILFSLILVLDFIQGKKFFNRLTLKSIAGIGIIFVVLLSFFARSLLIQSANVVFQRDTEKDSSLFSRTADLYFGFRASIKAPLFGHGSNYDDYRKLTKLELGWEKYDKTDGISNAIIDIAYRYGFFLLIIYVVIIYMGMFRSSRQRDTILVTILYCGLYMVSPVLLSLFAFMIILFDTKDRVYLQ